MKILFAADGSSFTKKALTFLTGNKNLLGPGDELVVLHVQDAISAQIERKLARMKLPLIKPSRLMQYSNQSRNF